MRQDGKERENWQNSGKTAGNRTHWPLIHGQVRARQMYRVSEYTDAAAISTLFLRGR
jgi:hypothetical protein